MTGFVNKILLIIILCFTASFGVGQDIDNSSQFSKLEDYLKYAALHNAALEGRFQQWKAALEKVPQSEALSDPQFNFGYFINEVETRVGPQRSRIGIMQAFPWFGKLELRSDISSAKAQAARYEYEAEKLRLFNKVKVTWYEFAYMGQALKLAKDNLELLSYYEKIAVSKYQGATASHPDIVRAQIEFAILDEVVKSLEALKEPQVAKLAAILNLPKTVDLQWPDFEVIKLVELDRGVIYDAIIRGNPELIGMESLIDVGRGQFELAEKQSYPDFAIGVDWIQTDRAEMDVADSGKDPVVVMFSMNIPIWRDKNNAVRREAGAGLKATELKRMQMQNDKLALASELIYKIEDARRKMTLNKDNLGDRAQELVKVSEVAYQNGTIDFLSLIDAQRSRLKYKLQYYRSLADYCQRVSELEMLIGSEL